MGGGIQKDIPGRVPWLEKALLPPFWGQEALGSLSPPVGTLGLCEGGGCWCCPGWLSPAGSLVVEAGKPRGPASCPAPCSSLPHPPSSLLLSSWRGFALRAPSLSAGTVSRALSILESGPRVQRPCCPGDVSQSCLPIQTSLLPSTQGPFLGHLRAECHLPNTQLSQEGNDLVEPAQQDPSHSAPKGELMHFWCLLGFLEKLFVVAPCCAVPSSPPKTSLLDFGHHLWDAQVDPGGV